MTDERRQDDEMMTASEACDLGICPKADAGAARRRGFAIAALVLGILSAVTLSGGLVLSLLAISFAIAARDPASRRITGRAKAGLILGIVGIVLLVVSVGAFFGLLFLFLDALEKGCQQASEDISDNLGNNLKNNLGIFLFF